MLVLGFSKNKDHVNKRTGVTTSWEEQQQAVIELIKQKASPLTNPHSICQRNHRNHNQTHLQLCIAYNAQPSHTLLAQYSTQPAKFLLDSSPTAVLGNLLSILFSTATSFTLVLWRGCWQLTSRTVSGLDERKKQKEGGWKVNKWESGPKVEGGANENNNRRKNKTRLNMDDGKRGETYLPVN